MTLLRAAAEVKGLRKGRGDFGQLLARRLAVLNIDLARETYLDAFTASLFGARSTSLSPPVTSRPRPALPRTGRGEGPRAVDLLLDAFAAITVDYERAVPVCRAAVDPLHRDMSSPSADLFPLLRTPCSSAPLFPRDHQQARKGGPPQARRRSTLLARYAVRRSSSMRRRSSGRIGDGSRIH